MIRLKLVVESVWNFQAEVLSRQHYKLVILERYHLEYIEILPLQEQVVMVDTSANQQ